MKVTVTYIVFKQENNCHRNDSINFLRFFPPRLCGVIPYDGRFRSSTFGFYLPNVATSMRISWPVGML